MAVKTYRIIYKDADGVIVGIGDSLTPGSGQSAATLALPADFDPTTYVVDTDANPVVLTAAPDTADEADGDKVKSSYLEAYRAEINIVRPRLQGLVWGEDSDANALVRKWLESRWQALRNLYQARTLHIAGTATAVTNAIRIHAAENVVFGATDAFDAESIADSIVKSPAPDPGTYARLFHAPSGNRVALADSITYGGLDSSYKLFHISWLRDDEPGTIAAITDAARS